LKKMSVSATDGKKEKEQQNPVLNIIQFDKEPAAIISGVNIQNVLQNETHLYPLSEECFKQNSLPIKVHGRFSFIPVLPTNFYIV